MVLFLNWFYCLFLFSHIRAVFNVIKTFCRLPTRAKHQFLIEKRFAGGRHHLLWKPLFSIILLFPVDNNDTLNKLTPWSEGWRKFELLSYLKFDCIPSNYFSSKTAILLRVFVCRKHLPLGHSERVEFAAYSPVFWVNLKTELRCPPYLIKTLHFQSAWNIDFTKYFKISLIWATIYLFYLYT